MRILLLGATGATGKLLLKELLDRGHQVLAIVRSPERIPEVVRKHPDLVIKQSSILDIGDKELTELVKGCDAVASCLGHNMSLKGIWGPPRRLVRDTVQSLCRAISSNKPFKPVRFVLMNTTGNRNRDLNEPISFRQRFVTFLFRTLLPPQADNEQAAEYLRVQIGQENPYIHWAAVRPDALINEETVSEYKVHPSPTRDPVFNPGKTSRINVAHFMADLISKDDIWNQWVGQMPVVYN